MADVGLIHAFCKGLELQAQIQQSKKESTDNYFDIWWLGQSGFLIQWNKNCILFDPYLSDSLTIKYDGTKKPHVRISELVIKPELLNCIDIVTSSHNHTDHLDGETLIPLIRVNPEITFIIPEANRLFVSERVKCDPDFPIGLNAGEHIDIKNFRIFSVPAAHNTIERDEKGQCKFMGFVVQFGKWSVYHSGDTLWYDDIVKTLKPFHLDLAFLPINGNDPSRGVAGNLNAKEAAQLGKELGVQLVIPHHYDLFEFNTADPLDFEREAKAVNQPYKILKLGERFSFR
jgi:L-ascorbate metabolism protein UlaG (beta-lactamase superfamily)